MIATPSNIFLRYLFRWIGEARGKRLLSWYVGRKTTVAQVEMPLHLESATKVLCILPENALEALHQYRTIISLASAYPACSWEILGGAEITDYFSSVRGVSRCPSWDGRARQLFTPQFAQVVHQIHASGYNLCLLLDSNPSLCSLYMTQASGAPIRIGFRNAAEFPFVNIAANPSAGRIYRTDRNLYLLEVLGVPVAKGIRFSVGKPTLNEVGLLVKEQISTVSQPMIGIDISWFYDVCGEGWTQSCITAARNIPGHVVFGIASRPMSERMRLWCKNNQLPVCEGLSASRLAGLVVSCAVMMCGTSALYELTHLLHAAGIGLFETHDEPLYFKPASHVRAVSYCGRPNGETIDGIMHASGDLFGRAV